MRKSALLLALALSGRVSAREAPAPLDPPFSPGGYVRALEKIVSLLESGQLEEAQDWARELREAHVAFGGEVLSTDPTVLEGITRARDAQAAQRCAAPIRRLVAALRATPRGAPAASAEPQPEVLVRLTPRDEAPKGGTVAEALRSRPLSISARIGQSLLGVWDWVFSVIEEILDWLARFEPRDRHSPSQGGATTAAIVVVALAAAVLAVLAYRTLRRGGTIADEIESDQVLRTAEDEDPLSREVGEWERHARDLAAAGRWREAVRAWYHAVLVSLFQAGLLHYQKGRTNWEYVSRLSPETIWRPTFLDLTRLFDREWYGRPSSDAEAVRECSRSAREILEAVGGGGRAA